MCVRHQCDLTLPSASPEVTRPSNSASQVYYSPLLRLFWARHLALLPELCGRMNLFHQQPMLCRLIPSRKMAALSGLLQAGTSHAAVPPAGAPTAGSLHPLGPQLVAACRCAVRQPCCSMCASSVGGGAVVHFSKVQVGIVPLWGTTKRCVGYQACRE